MRKDTHTRLKSIVKTLSNGARQVIGTIANSAAAGVIVGILVLTELRQKVAMIIFSCFKGNLLLALIFTMLVAIVLGMGMSTTTACAICASVLAPALVKDFHVPGIIAHSYGYLTD